MTYSFIRGPWWRGPAVGWGAAALSLAVAVPLCAEESVPAAVPPAAAPPAAPLPPALPAPSPAAPTGAQAPAAAASDTAPGSTKSDEFDQRIKEWYYRHYVKNEEVAIAQGAWAILRKNGGLDIDRPVFTFFRDVDGTGKREKVVVTGATGQFIRADNRARIEGQVVVREEDGSELRTEHLNLDLAQRRLTTDDRVEILKPGLALTGIGLDGSRLLHVLTLRSKVTVSMRGNRGDQLLGGGAAAGPPKGAAAEGETFVTCEGPATLAHLAPPRPETGATDELRLTDRVAISRHDPNGLTRFKSDAATVDVFHGPGEPASGGTPPAMVTEPRRAVLTGNVQVFEERGLTGTAQRLVWTRADESLRLEGEGGVRVARASHTVQGRTVVVLRRDNRVSSRGDAQVTFVPQPAAPGSAASSWTVKSDALDVLLQPEAKEVDRLEASGHVEIASDAESASGASARRRTCSGEGFRWDAPAHRGVLTGSPAGVQEGSDRMMAARIVLFPVEQRVLLQGPKRVELEGRVTAAARGDIVIANAEGTIEIGDGAVVSTPDLRMEADRLRMFLAQGGGGGFQRALGWGHVHVSDRINASDVFGDYLRWDVGAEEVAVEGSPFAKIVQGSVYFQGQEFWVSRRTGDIRAVNRAGTKGLIQVQPEGGKSAN